MPTDITLEDEDCALILRGEEGMEFIIPDMDPDDTPPDRVIAITIMAVMFKTNDKDFQDFLFKKYNEYLQTQWREELT